MNTEILNEVGLTEGEIKVYLALLKLGTTKTGQVIKETNMASSATYRAISSLANKGLISFITKNNVKYFQAKDPKNLLKIVEDKKQKLLEIIPLLAKKDEEVNQEAQVYEGYKAMTTAYEECLKELDKGEESLFLSIGEEDLSNENTQTFFMNLAMKRKERGIGMRGIAPPKTREIFEKYPIKMNMKYINFKLPTGVSIYKTKIIIVSWKEKPIAIVIESKNIVNSYKNFFEEMWKIAKE